MSVTVSAFYKFVTVTDGEVLRAYLLAYCEQHQIKGTILIAPEGLNATIAGAREAVQGLLELLRSDPRFADLESKDSRSETLPFQRLKVKLKREIVTFGVPEADPAKVTGTYVAPENWNALIQDPSVVMVDTRNAYEVRVGTFPGARNPQTQAFKAFPDYVKKALAPGKQPKVAMFCTGGIRCEKASAYLLSLGFKEVFHLKGGILNYLETVPREDSLFQGECFVFDARVALDHGVVEGSHMLCAVCGHPVAQKHSSAGSQATPCPHCTARHKPAIPPSQ